MTPEQQAKKFEDDLIKEAQEKMNEVADFILSQSQKNLVRNGSVDMAGLLNNVSIDKSDPWVKTITFHQDYSSYVEYGTEPHWIPSGVLEGWIMRKLGVPKGEASSVDFLIRRKIAKEGIDPKPFVRPAINMAEARFR